MPRKTKNIQDILKKHVMWLNNEEGGERAYLNGAYLNGAYLNGADLRRANVDFSNWPLWCGSLGVKVCKRIAAQLAYHFCCLNCNDPEYIKARNAVVPFANTFHRVAECGILEPMEAVKDE